MRQVVGRSCAVAEDDYGFREVDVGEEEHVEVVLSVGDWDLEMHLPQRHRYCQLLRIHFADEDWRFARCSREFL